MTGVHPDPVGNGVILPDLWANIIIVGSAVLGALFALFNYFLVARVKVDPKGISEGEKEILLGSLDEKQAEKLAVLQKKISDGATAFLFAEYTYMAVFMVLMGGVILFLIGPTEDGWDSALFSLLAFVLGAFTSIASGWIGMRIAVFSNARCTTGAAFKGAKGYVKAFTTAMQGGIVMGFSLTALGLLNLFIGIYVFKLYFKDDMVRLMGTIAAYGLGGSSIAMFGRVGGGIFTKAADVGSDLVGKVVHGLDEDDPRNAGVIADCIGDNVGDIAGMGADLFGSFAESTCAALVISSADPALAQCWSAMMYPLLLTAVGIICCIFTTFAATAISPAQDQADIEPTLKKQLVISCVLATIGSFVISVVALPTEFKMYFMNGSQYDVKSWYCFVAVACGLWAGLAIGYITEYYTSNAYHPVQELADSCDTGAATNVIYGLALGYKSVIIPCFALSLTIWISYNMCGVYGVALGALGILSTMCIALTIDAYGPIADNAGGLAELAELGEDVRDITDALDAAGNTTAAIGKGYAIGSAALVSLALYGAFLTRAYTLGNLGKPVHVNIIDPRTFFGLLMGAMLPYWFSALTMKSVGVAAKAMVKEIARQFDEIPGLMEYKAEPDYNRCVQIATKASLKEMLPPGALVCLSPIIVGVFLGKEALAGLLPGALVSGVQIAISASNTGGAWDNAKKYLNEKKREKKRTNQALTPEEESAVTASVIGDTIGDPMKDTYGPALNILIKLMAIISVVFAPVVADPHLGGLIFNQLLSGWAAKDAPIGDSL